MYVAHSTNMNNDRLPAHKMENLVKINWGIYFDPPKNKQASARSGPFSQIYSHNINKTC